jgi:hypothetical protein
LGITNRMRAEWVLSEAYLRREWQESGLSLAIYVAINKAAIDFAIRFTTTGR